MQKASVLKFPRFYPHVDSLDYPACDSPEKEDQKQLIKTVFKRHFPLFSLSFTYVCQYYIIFFPDFPHKITLEMAVDWLVDWLTQNKA